MTLTKYLQTECGGEERSWPGAVSQRWMSSHQTRTTLEDVNIRQDLGVTVMDQDKNMTTRD